MSLTVTDILKFREYVGDHWKNLLIQANMDFNLIYPVGSIYMSTNNTNPSLLFGGTWEQLENRFLLGAGSSYTAGNTGGSATMAHTHATSNHTLTVAEMPKHTGHVYNEVRGGNWAGFLSTSDATSYGSSGRGWNVTAGNELHPVGDTLGGGGAHNHGDTGAASNSDNMPPYLVVYMWKRLTLAPHLPYPTNVMTDIGEVATAFPIPSAGSSVSYNMTGMTNEYELVKWNFSSSPENIPPVDLTCNTYNGYFTITNNGGTTSETIRPMFIKAKKITVTAH